MNLDLDGRVAVVTGASRGLGRNAAESLVAEGARRPATRRAMSTGPILSPRSTR